MARDGLSTVAAEWRAKVEIEPLTLRFQTSNRNRKERKVGRFLSRDASSGLRFDISPANAQGLVQVPSLYRQQRTPPCDEHAPLPVASLEVPSLHVAPIRVPLVGGGGADPAHKGPGQTLHPIPPWLEQVPEAVVEHDQAPSAHRAVGVP